MAEITPDQLDSSEQYRTRNEIDKPTKSDAKKGSKLPDPTLEDPEQAALVQPVSKTNKD